MSLQEATRRQRQRAATHAARRKPVEPQKPHTPNPRRVYPFKAWCALNSFSVATGKRIIARGDGPKVTQLSKRAIGIREDHNAEWQDSRVRSGGK